MKFIIEKIQENIVTLENMETSQQTTIKKEDIVIEIKEGDMIEFINQTFYPCVEETKARKDEIDKKLKDLFLD